MLQEQAALDDRNRLVRTVQVLSSDEMPFRSHIAKNIRLRLDEEAQRDKSEALAMQHQCQNIRKHLTSMTNMRRDLSSLRSRVQLLAEEDTHAGDRAKTKKTMPGSLPSILDSSAKVRK